MAINGPRWAKRKPFSTKKYPIRAPFGLPFLLNIGVFGGVSLMVQLWVGI